MTSIENFAGSCGVLYTQFMNGQIDLNEFQIAFNTEYQQAREMHKQEIIDARDNMQKSCIELANKINPHLFEFDKKDAEQYYQETFVSKGSDTLKDYHIVDTNKMIEKTFNKNNGTSNQTS
jgi:hypothetical protein